MFNLIRCAAVTGIVFMALFTAEARATAISVANFSFETPDEGSSGASNDVVTSWTASGSGSGGSFAYGVYAPVNPTQYVSNGTDGLPNGEIVPDGKQAAFESAIVTLSQTLTGSTLADSTTYILSVWVGHRDDPGFTFPSSVTIELLAGGNVIDSLSVSDPGQGKWADEILTFNSPASDAFAGETLGIALLDGGSTGQVNFDDVTLCTGVACNAATVPEPATLALLGTSFLGLGFLRRRKKAA